VPDRGLVDGALLERTDLAALAARSVALTPLSAPDMVPNAVRLAATTTTDFESFAMAAC
jgi:hypothetical protein